LTPLFSGVCATYPIEYIESDFSKLSYTQPNKLIRVCWQQPYTSFALKLLNKKAVIFSLVKKENASIAIATVTFYFEE